MAIKYCSSTTLCTHCMRIIPDAKFCFVHKVRRGGKGGYDKNCLGVGSFHIKPLFHSVVRFLVFSSCKTLSQSSFSYRACGQKIT